MDEKERIGHPGEGEYAPFYAGYISRVTEADVLGALEAQPDELRQLARRVAPDREQHRYAEGKWSIREVMGHLIDAERVFGYRAYCIARKESAPLPGFDENSYVARSSFHRQPLAELVEEFAAVRSVNLIALRRLAGDAWRLLGTANNHAVSTRALAYIMVGHARHHQEILRMRYGVE